MTFQEAVRSGFDNYANFAGRAGRPAFWYWVLFAFLVGLVASLVDEMFGGSNVIDGLVSLALLLPGLAVSVRRLHDIGKSGWNILWGLIPVLGWIYLIYLYIQPSEPGANAYGSTPVGAPAA
ncbi:MAG: DUF805 domain-containing protein [Dehalococcoidia bacterium]|nr:DUF805 domain-containing protein [Dehalococcoidia bacterium]